MDAGGKDAAAVTTVREDVCDLGFFATLELGASAFIHQDCHNSMSNMSVDSHSFVQQQQQVVDVVNHQIKPNDDQVSSMKLYTVQGLLYHKTCKPDFLCSWPSLNSYLK